MDIVNVNKATAQELQKIAGIGPVRAANVIKNRPFRDIYELSKVAGLGTKRMQQIFEQDILIKIK
jgi:competence protein ComEA